MSKNIENNKKVVFLLVVFTFLSNTFLFAGPCDKYFFSKTQKFVTNFNKNEFLKTTKRISQNQITTTLNSPETKLAYIAAKLQKESKLLVNQLENLEKLSKREIRSLIKLTKIFNNQGNISEGRLENSLSFFYRESNKNPDNQNQAYKYLKDQLMTKVSVGLVSKGAEEDSILKAKSLVKRSIDRLFANKRFQVFSNLYVNAPIVFTGGLPFLLKYDFYKIDENIIESAVLYGSEKATVNFFENNHRAIRKQVVYNKIKKYFNSVVLSVLVASSVYTESIRVIELSQQVKIETKRADEVLENATHRLEAETDSLIGSVDKLDLRDSFFELALINYEKENGFKLVEVDFDYQKLWEGIYGKAYPDKVDF